MKHGLQQSEEVYVKQPPLCHQQLIGLLDRPIAFHRCFVTLTGSITAALMLSQALYWQQRTKDDAGWWYKTRDEWIEETGMSRREQEGARKRLKELVILHEQLRGVPATLWYRVDEIRLLELLAKPAEKAASDPVPVGTKPPNWMGENVPTRRAKTAQLDGTKPPNMLARFAPTFKGTETTTETTTEITTTTPNPSSSHARSAEPEPARGGGGGDSAQNPNPERQEPAGNHENAAQEPNEEKTVFQEVTPSAPTTEGRSNTATENPKTVVQEERIDGQPVELIYPAKLTNVEYEDIAAQVNPLPPDIAQQMLDVIASRMQSGQIRTNPAALLRGVIRKYQVDPDAFDPSSGFQIADARRRRVEAAARLEAAQQASIRQFQEATPRRLSEVGRASLAAMLNTLRGG